MKKCLKCGTKFDDRFMFCPECGEQLVPVNECPNCHLELGPNAKFCPNCGAKVGQPAPAPQPQPAPAPAPQPAPQPAPAPQPYPQQPAPQPYPQQAPAQQPYPQQGYPQQQGYYGYQQPAKPARQKNPNIMKTVSRFVFMGMFIIAAILYLVGCLGAPFTYGGYDMDFTYYFKFNGIGNFGPAIEFAVFQYAFYYLALVGFFVSLGTGIAAIVRAFQNKDQPINTKPLKGMIMFVLPTLIYPAFCNIYSLGYGVILSLGWGSILLMVTAILAALTMGALKVLDGELKAKPIIANCLLGSALMFAVLAAALGTLPGGLTFAAMIVEASSIEAYIKNGAFFFAFAMMIFSLMSAIFLFTSLSRIARAERGVKGAVINVSLSIGFNTLAFIFAIIMGKGNIGSAIILPYVLMWVFDAFVIGLLVAGVKINPRRPVPPQQFQPQFQPQPQPQQPPYRY